MTTGVQHFDNLLIPILEQVSDSEIPVLPTMDMGVVRFAQIENALFKVQITPSCSGCSVMEDIGDAIKKALKDAGFNSDVALISSPAFTTDWFRPRSRKVLENYGIAAPLGAETDKDVLRHGKRLVKCPQCGSTNTKIVSQFGSTVFKAQFQYDACLEPFDYFKC